MGSRKNSTNLLESLRKLYSEIMALLSQDRARSSRNHGKMAGTQNIVTSLSECIDKLAANNSVEASHSQIPEAEYHSHDHAPFDQEASSGDELGELSLHLKDVHRHSGATLGVGDKLMQSTWEHFHTSIRLARQGDVKAAKLHAELTKNALNEAAHYLPEPVYSHFSKDVMKALEDISGQI